MSALISRFMLTDASKATWWRMPDWLPFFRRRSAGIWWQPSSCAPRFCGSAYISSRGTPTQRRRLHGTVLGWLPYWPPPSCFCSRRKHVVSFEPSLRNLNFLYRNLWENKLSSVKIFPVGLAKQSGLSRIYRIRRNIVVCGGLGAGGDVKVFVGSGNDPGRGSGEEVSGQEAANQSGRGGFRVGRSSGSHRDIEPGAETDMDHGDSAARWCHPRRRQYPISRNVRNVLEAWISMQKAR